MHQKKYWRKKKPLQKKIGTQSLWTKDGSEEEEDGAGLHLLLLLLISWPPPSPSIAAFLVSLSLSTRDFFVADNCYLVMENRKFHCRKRRIPYFLHFPFFIEIFISHWLPCVLQYWNLWNLWALVDGVIVL